MKFVFLTHCDSWLMDSFGGNKLIKSFKYFHPDLEIVHLDETYINDLIKHSGLCRYSMMPLTMLDIKRQYNADYVCHLDADSLVLGRFDEILLGDYEVAGVRNNNDDFKNDERANRPYPIQNIANHLYLNCGCISTNSEKFLHDWIDLNTYIIKEYGKINVIKGVEQDTYNLILYANETKFKTKILDPLGSNLHYGCSANMHANNPIPQSVKDGWNAGDNQKLNNWGSWKDIEFKDNQFYLYNRIVKLLHMSSGGNPKKTKKVAWDLFNDKTIKVLIEITDIYS